jgi:hypothetical protein
MAPRLFLRSFSPPISTPVVVAMIACFLVFSGQARGQLGDASSMVRRGTGLVGRRVLKPSLQVAGDRVNPGQEA